MPIYATPEINKVAPKDRVSRWELVCKVAEPFPGPKPDEFGFWFNYFWKEVKELQKITALQQQKAAEVFLSVFEPVVTTVNRQTVTTFKVQGSFAGRDASFKENVLRQLLLIGFRRVALESPAMRPQPRPGRRFPPPLMVGNAAEMNLYTVLGKEADTLQIGFRADSRSWEELCQHKGFRSKARSEDSPIHKIYGLDKPWHPFNNPVYRDSLFLRLGSTNADNCLQTVISIGSNFSGAAHFPILKDYVLVFQAKGADGRFLAIKPLDEWTSADEQAALAHPQRVRAVRNASGEIDHLEKDNYFYAFHLRGVRLFNTEKFFSDRGDSKFPERGADEIPLGNILAEVRYTQKWFYSLETREIALYKIEFDTIRWVPSESYVDAVLGEGERKRLQIKLESEINAAKNRSDFQQQHEEYKRTPDKKKALLSGKERIIMYRLLKAYQATPGAVNTTKAEKAAVRAEMVKMNWPAASLAKFDALDPGHWTTVRLVTKSMN